MTVRELLFCLQGLHPDLLVCLASCEDQSPEEAGYALVRHGDHWASSGEAYVLAQGPYFCLGD